LEKAGSRLTVPALLSLAVYSLLSILQILNLPLAVPAIAGLTLLLTDKRFSLGVFAGLSTLLVTYLIGGSILCLESLFLVILPATVMAICIKVNKSSVYTLVLMVVPFVLVAIAFYAAVGDSADYIEEIKPGLRADLMIMIEDMNIQERFNLTDSNLEDFTESYLGMIAKVLRFFPAIILASMTAVSALAYMLCAYYYRREGRFLFPFPSVDKWKIEERLIIVIGFGMLLVILGSKMFANVGENITAYMAVLFSIGGLSLLEFYMRGWKFSRFLRFVIYLCVAILNIYAGVILAVAGLLDSHFDFRHVRAAKIG